MSPTQRQAMRSNGINAVSRRRGVIHRDEGEIAGGDHRTFSEGELQGKHSLTMGRRRARTRMREMKHSEDQRAKSIQGNREE